jgi:hypothetical protein
MHNNSSYLSAEKIGRARDMNLIPGSKYVVMASSDPKPGLDGWKAIAEALNVAADQLESVGLKAGYRNHQRELLSVENQRPIEILAKNTKPSVMLQLDGRSWVCKPQRAESSQFARNLSASLKD